MASLFSISKLQSEPEGTALRRKTNLFKKIYVKEEKIKKGPGNMRNYQRKMPFIHLFFLIRMVMMIIRMFLLFLEWEIF